VRFEEAGVSKKLLIGAVGAAVVVTGGAGAFAIAGDGVPGEERATAEPIVAASITARGTGATYRAGEGGTIGTYFAQSATRPPEGAGLVQEIKCPRRAGSAIDGGARTSQGIVVSYLSKAAPSGDVRDRSYYVGVDDISADNSANAGAFVEVVCAKGINVR